MLQYILVGDGDDRNIVVFVPRSAPLAAHSSHPRFADIVAGAEAGDESILALFDQTEAVATRFERLSERVTVARGRIYFDGEEVASPLTNQVVRFLEEDEALPAGARKQSWRPLVAFFENVQANPNEHSRTQLYDWLSAADFTITRDGMIVGYKGVEKLADGSLASIFEGRATVNGQVHKGRIPTQPGTVVEMPRGNVEFNPAVACSTGLHFGTYGYASGWARGAMLEVHVNPRDVVSVPTDCSAQKCRTCRYKVVRVIDAPWTSPVAYGDDDYAADEDEWEEGYSF